MTHQISPKQFTRSVITCLILCCLFVPIMIAQGADTEDAHRDHEGRSFVYIITNPDGPNAIEAFTRNPLTGRLTHLDRFPTGGAGDPFVGGFEQHSLVSNGEFLYAVNPGNDTISAFKIRRDGALELLGDPVPSGGRRPVSLALHDDLLYVANQGTIPGNIPDPNVDLTTYSGFIVKPDGSLSPIAGSTVTLRPGDSPADILINKSGTVLVGMRLVRNVIDSFRIGSVAGGNLGAEGDDARLTNQQTVAAAGGPFGSTFNPVKPTQLFVTLAVPDLGSSAPGIASYEVNRQGVLSLIGTLTDQSLVDPCWVAITPGGSYLWTSSFNIRTLTLFAIDSKGNLTQVSAFNPMDNVPNPDPSMPPVIVGSTDITLDPAGRYLYQLRAFSVPDGTIPVLPQIHVLRVTSDLTHDAGVQLVQAVDLPNDLKEAGVMGLVVIDRED